MLANIWCFTVFDQLFIEDSGISTTWQALLSQSLKPLLRQTESFKFWTFSTHTNSDCFSVALWSAWWFDCRNVTSQAYFLRNLSVLGNIHADFFLFRKQHMWSVTSCLGLMHGSIFCIVLWWSYGRTLKYLLEASECLCNTWSRNTCGMNPQAQEAFLEELSLGWSLQQLAHSCKRNIPVLHPHEGFLQQDNTYHSASQHHTHH